MYSSNSTRGQDMIVYIQSSGLVLGNILGCFAADLVGRKNIMFLSYALMMSSHAMTAVCSSFECFAISRFLSSFFALLY